jgi:hypothetical protein
MNLWRNTNDELTAVCACRERLWDRLIILLEIGDGAFDELSDPRQGFFMCPFQPTKTRKFGTKADVFLVLL